MMDANEMMQMLHACQSEDRSNCEAIRERTLAKQHAEEANKHAADEITHLGQEILSIK